MKEKREKFLELWQDPKYKSLIKIGLYLLFILILVLIVRVKRATYKPSGNNNANNTQVVEKTIIQKIENMKNYEYEVSININNNIDNLKGIKYNDINEFENTKTSGKYEIKDNVIYKKGTQEKQELFYINLNNLDLNNIKTFLTDQNKKSEISYNNNETKKEYNIVNFNIINEIYNKSIVLTTYENENYIYKIEINIIELMKEKDKNMNNYNITINYNNINQIKGYNSK